MKLSSFTFTREQVVDIAKRVGNVEISESLLAVLNAAIDYPEYSCSIKMKATSTLTDYVTRWVHKFDCGYKNRPTQRKSNSIHTVHDPILDIIIETKLPTLECNTIRDIKHAHRLSMSAENLAGSLLEEYLSAKLLKYGWHCCWGETLKSIDFVNREQSRLLQVKNSNNSENSSSKTVRDGTKIEHWFRRFSKRNKTNWPKLNTLIGISVEEDILTEEKYLEFVQNTISNNKGAIYIEEDSPWYSISGQVSEQGTLNLTF